MLGVTITNKLVMFMFVRVMSSVVTQRASSAVV
jgi:hypothetical protein